MPLFQRDREEVRKKALKEGYKQSSTDLNKMIHQSGKSIKFSDSGHSVRINSYGYDTRHNAIKSTKW